MADLIQMLTLLAVSALGRCSVLFPNNVLVFYQDALYLQMTYLIDRLLFYQFLPWVHVICCFLLIPSSFKDLIEMFY